MVGPVRSVGSHTILWSYVILHDPTYDPTIFVILLRFWTFWWDGIVKSCDFTIRITILTTMITPAVALQDKTSSLTRQLAHDSNSRLVPVVSSSHQNILFGCNWLFTFHTHPTINILIPTKCRASRENFERETLEKNKIDSSTIFILWFSKFLYSHPLHWYILERYISQILFSSYPYLWKGFLVLEK